MSWRGKKFLGWVPFKSSAIKIHNGKISYNKNEFSFWNSRELPEDAKIKTGSFCQDKLGRWFLNVTFKSEQISIHRTDDKKIGIDIGIKYHSLPKAKQERKLHAKVANIRQDYLHKEPTKLVKKCSLIVVGDVPCKFMNRNKKLAGISLDSGIGIFKNMLRYKAFRAASIYKEISERDSIRTCSKCSEILPRIELGVSTWTCEKCKTIFDRDVNASINILNAYKNMFPIGQDRPTRTKKNSS